MDQLQALIFKGLSNGYEVSLLVPVVGGSTPPNLGGG
jgi:hypothetical protein